MRSSILAVLLLINLTANLVQGVEPERLINFIPLPGMNTSHPDTRDQHRGPDELDGIIRNWHRAKSTIERFDAEFDRVTTDDTFGIARYSHGSLAFDLRGRGFIKQQASDVSPGLSRGKYEAKRGDYEHWCWTGDAIYRIDHHSKQYEMIVIPLEDRGRWNRPVQRRARPRLPDRPSPPPLPMDAQEHRGTEVTLGFLLNQALYYILFSSMSQDRDASTPWLLRFLVPQPIPKEVVLKGSVAELLDQFDVRLLRKTDTQIQLELRPLTRDKLSVFLKMQVALSLDTYELRALKLFDITGTKADLFVLKNVSTNEQPDGSHRDLTVPPDLFKYKRILNVGVRTATIK